MQRGRNQVVVGEEIRWGPVGRLGTPDRDFPVRGSFPTTVFVVKPADVLATDGNRDSWRLGKTDFKGPPSDFLASDNRVAVHFHFDAGFVRVYFVAGKHALVEPETTPGFASEIDGNPGPLGIEVIKFGQRFGAQHEILIQSNPDLSILAVAGRGGEFHF